MAASSHAPQPTLKDIPTPSLVLDRARMTANIGRMKARIADHGIGFRPHLKTGKSADVAQLMMAGPSGPATVSTLKEVEQFAAAGVADMTYAVGIVPDKLDRVSALRRRGVELSIILDSIEAAEAVAAQARRTADPIPVLVEIDSDGHRAGLEPSQSELLIAVGRTLHDGGALLRGVLTHAGGSYNSRSVSEIEAAAQAERDAVVTSAGILREAGLPAPVVSVGSTPTATFARDLSGVTEARPGVFVFFDLVMAGLGVCALDDIAITVLATVVGKRPEKGWILVDAGWMAMSRDRGTATQPLDQGYGVAADLSGQPYPDLIMVAASQEQGTLALRPGSTAALPDLHVGDRVRIYPNHACATAAQYDRYQVLGDGDDLAETWERFGGW